MLKVHQILVTAIVLATGTVAMSACGQKGPLFLPPATAQPANAAPQSATAALPPAPDASSAR